MLEYTALYLLFPAKLAIGIKFDVSLCFPHPINSHHNTGIYEIKTTGNREINNKILPPPTTFCHTFELKQSSQMLKGYSIQKFMLIITDFESV